MKTDTEKIPSPCFLLDEALLINNLKIIDNLQRQCDIKVILALKGFAMFHVFPLIKQYISGTTASSLNEAMLGHEYFGEEVHLYAPAYKDTEFDELKKYASHITFNTLTQWQKFKNQSKDKTCAIRINPEYSVTHTPLYDPGTPDSRLGITATEAPLDLPEGITGLHFHNLCEDDSHKLEMTLQAVEEKFHNWLHQAKFLNIGGGHLVTDENYDRTHFTKIIQSIKHKYNLDIIMEPGGAIAWQTGYLMTEILDIIPKKDFYYAILDVSVTCHMPDCLEMPYTPSISHAKAPAASQYVYRMGGLSCLAGDFAGDYGFEKPLKTGDRLFFEDMMHYTMVKTTMFNGINLPHIGIWKKDGYFEHVKSFGYEDYKTRLS